MVKSLQVVSVCGYVPFDKRPGCEKPLEVPHGLFSPFVLQSMRNFILCKALSLRQYNSPLKVFIRRNSNYRMLINATEVEAFLLGCGFVIVEPENLSFIEQVELFHNAGIIIGASGAALANLIFCKPEAKIIILTSDYKDMIFGYWQNMAAAVENNVTFVKGKSTDKFTSLHSDFSIAIPDLINAISY
jgi:capsular polysaccharide biosynthesis protein